jgi:N-acetylneuraminic acid mutarotase
MQNIFRTNVFATVGALIILASASHAQSQWVQDAAMPMGGAVTSFSFSIGNNVYVGGGLGIKSMYCYNTEAKTWTKKADVPGVSHDRSSAIAFNIGANGYVGLGYDSIPQRVLKDLWEYDTANDSWTKKSNFVGNARQGSFAFVIGQNAYVGGGVDQAANYYNDFYEYNPAGDVWQLIGSHVPQSLVYAATFVIADTGFVCTGATMAGEVATVYSFTPNPAAWTTRRPFPGDAREGAIGYTLDGKGTVGLGVSYTSSGTFNDLWIYDPSLGGWPSLSKFPGSKRTWASCVQTLNSVFVGGGYDGIDLSTSYSDFWELDGSGASVSVSRPASRIELNVFPNPFATSTTAVITSNSVGARSIALYDVMGRIVYAAIDAVPTTEHTSTFRINATALKLPEGAYFLRATSGETVLTRSIVLAP